MTAKRSRVPDIGVEPEHFKFLDSLDKRRLTPIAHVASDDVSDPAAPDVDSVPDPSITAVDTTGATHTTPYGFSEDQANAIISTINDLITHVTAHATAINALVAVPQAADASGAVNDIKTQFNALLAEMQARDAMEKP